MKKIVENKKQHNFLFRLLYIASIIAAKINKNGKKQSLRVKKITKARQKKLILIRAMCLTV